MTSVRPAAVPGWFYPAKAEELGVLLDDCVDSTFLGHSVGRANPIRPSSPVWPRTLEPPIPVPVRRLPTAVMHFARALGKRVQLLKHCHSGNTLPMRKVVSYAGVAVEQ